MMQSPLNLVHPAMQELCLAARFDGTPPRTLSSQSILAILEATETDIDENGVLFWMIGHEVVPLKHGQHLRSLIGPD